MNSKRYGILEITEGKTRTGGSNTAPTIPRPFPGMQAFDPPKLKETTTTTHSKPAESK